MPVHWLKTMTLSPATDDEPVVAVDAAAAALPDPPRRAASRALDLLLADSTPELCLSFSTLLSGTQAQTSSAGQVQQLLRKEDVNILHLASDCPMRGMMEAKDIHGSRQIA